MPQFNAPGNIYGGFNMRKDVWDSFGLATPTTLAQLLDGLRAIRAKVDYYPFALQGYWFPMVGFFSYNVGTAFDYSSRVNKFIYSPVDDTERYMKALDFDRTLVAEKLCDPDALNFNTTKHNEICYNGKAAFSFNYRAEIIDFNTQAGKIDPKTLWVNILPPKNEYNEYGKMLVTMAGSGYWGLSVSARSKHVKEVMAFLDWRLSDEKATLINWGWEGVTYKVGANGVKEWLPTVKTVVNPKGTLDVVTLGADGYSGFMGFRDVIAYNGRLLSKEGLEWDALYNANAKNVTQFPGPQVTLTTEMQAKKSAVENELNTILNEAQNKYILGKIARADVVAAIDKIKSEGKYKAIVDALNAEFDKIKSTWRMADSIN